MSLPLISVASTLLAAAVGASYFYVDLSLNRMGVSATAIGLNASMPALGWLLATPLMPWALRRFNPNALLQGLLLAAVLAAVGFGAFPDADAWMALRFLFGGGTGMAFRLVEYWINAASPESHRARNVGVYATAFSGGALLGGLATAQVGVEGWPPIVMMVVLVLAAAMVFASLGDGPPAIGAASAKGGWRACLGAGFIAFFAILIYGMFEAVPFTLMPVYSVRQGLSDEWAVWCASAALMGQIVLATPLGMAGDRVGKLRMLLWSAGAALAVPAVIPQVMAAPQWLLLAMFVWGGAAGSLYNFALAMLADRFEGAQLASANALFGTLYAFGSLCGPVLHGVAMDAWNPQGLMVSAACLFGIFLWVCVWHSWRER